MKNIAEGFARHSHTDFARFLDIARGSSTEVRRMTHLGHDIGYLAKPQADGLFQQTDKVLTLIAGLQRHLRHRPLRKDSNEPR